MEKTVKELRQNVRKNFATINRRMKILEKIEQKKDVKIDFLQTQKEIFNSITKSKYKKKGGVYTGSISKMNKSQLELLLLQQKLFIKSKRSTIKGRKEIEKKSYRTFSQKYNISEKKYKKLLNFFDTDEYDWLKESFPRLASDQIIELNQNYGDSRLIDVIDNIRSTKDISLYTIPSYNVRSFITDLLEGDNIYETYQRYSTEYTEF